jgi:hypothetical protein
MTAARGRRLARWPNGNSRARRAARAERGGYRRLTLLYRRSAPGRPAVPSLHGRAGVRKGPTACPDAAVTDEPPVLLLS